MAIEDENTRTFLSIINAIIPSLNGKDPDKLEDVDYVGIEKQPTKSEYFGPKVMIESRYLILLYVAKQVKLFKRHGRPFDNDIYFSANDLKKIANAKQFPEPFKFERSRAVRDHYSHYVAYVIHKQKEVPRGKDANKTVKTDLVTLSKEGEKYCETIIDTLLAAVPEQKRPEQKLRDIVVPTHDEKESQSYGLSWLQSDRFEFHTSTETDFENWKKGFDLSSIKARMELRREGLIADIKNKLENQGRLLIVGQSGISKTTILMELICDYFDDGYEVLHNLESTDTGNMIELVNFIRERLSKGKKILVAIDNAHEEKMHSIFYFIDKVSNSQLAKKLKFILTARQPEFDWLLNGLDKVEEETRKSISKLIADPNFIYEIPYFTKVETMEFVKRYLRITDERIIDKMTDKIYDESKGDPLMVKFHVLDKWLEQDVEEISDRYLGSPLERKTILICSILHISNTEITDKLLEKCGVLEAAHNLDGSVLRRNPNGSWKTKHRRWAVKLFSYFFNEKTGIQLEQRKQDFKDSLIALYKLREEKITYSAINAVYYIATENFVPKDVVESVFQQSKSQITTKPTIAYLSVSHAHSITDAYCSLREHVEGSKRLDGLAIDNNLKKANRCYDLRDYEGTMKYCDEALELDPSSTDASYLKRLAMAKIYDGI